MTITLIKGKKGLIFSIDAMFSFVIILFSVFGLLYFISTNYENQKETIQDFYLMEKTFLITDSLIKNNNPKNYLLGSAIINLDKKRTLSNELKREYLLLAQKFELEDFFVKELTWSNETETKKMILSEKNSNNCISAKRFVKIDDRKSIIELKGCLIE